jgi:hypothetical protein
VDAPPPPKNVVCGGNILATVVHGLMLLMAVFADWNSKLCIHIWEEYLTWYYTKGFIIVKISNDWYYSSYTVFLFQEDKRNLLSPLKLLVPGASNLKEGAVSCCVKYTILILFCLSAGWGEHKDAHGWLCIAEDMSGIRPNFIFYEIVRKTYFKFQQQNSPINSFQHSTIVSCYTTQWNNFEALTALNTKIYSYVLITLNKDQLTPCKR